MDLSLEAVTLLLYLTPGLFASLLLNTLITRRDKDAFAKFVEALTFSLLIYAITRLIGGELPDPFAQVADKPTVGALFRALINNAAMLWLPMALAIGLPLLLGYSHRFDLHMRLLRFARVTDRTSREGTWQDTMMDNDVFVDVHLTDGRRLSGYPTYWSDNFEDPLLYLSAVQWYDDRGRPKSFTCSKLLIMHKSSIELIAFSDIPANAQKKRWYHCKHKETTPCLTNPNQNRGRSRRSRNRKRRQRKSRP